MNKIPPFNRILMFALEAFLLIWTNISPVQAASETWTPTGALHTARRYHTATLLTNSYVLIAGGTNGSALSSAELYNPSTGTWSPTGQMNTARYNHRATLLANGMILVEGGYNNGSPLSSAELYDPSTGTWTFTGAMQTARYYHKAILLPSGKVLVMGGNNTAKLSSAELYDPVTGTWTPTGSMSTVRYEPSATLLLSGKVLVVGGIGDGGHLASTEIYDPSTGAWTATGSLSTGRYDHLATLLPSGKLLIAGGYNFSNISSSEIYDPATGVWTSTGALATARYSIKGALLMNGKVLAAGGYNNGGPLSSVELYDPSTGTWAPTGALNVTRYDYSATVLSTGRVLLAGGNGSSGNNLASAEFYDDSSFTLTLSAVMHGAITGNAVSYSPGSSATLTATPSSGYIFAGWTGNATGLIPVISVVMDTNKTIGAIFEKDFSDDDGDGLSAYDEIVTYGTDPNKSDTDNDDLKDGWEVGLGRFSIVAGSFTWTQARTDAHARGGELACFPTEARWNRAMESLGPDGIDNYTGLWIGATDAANEGIWIWVNGEPFNFSLWATSRPYAVAGNSLDYAQVEGGSGAEIGRWYDRSPLFTRDGYILEIGHATDPKDADKDSDGLKDGAEQAAGTNPFLADTDSDGFGDLFELNTHFNPTSASSTPDSICSIRNLPSIPASVEFSFNAASGVSYRIEASTDLVGWNSLEPVVVGLGGITSRVYPKENFPTRYFRVRRN